MKPRLQFWFDFASTYSYLTAMRIGPLAGAAGIEVDWRPFLLGPIFAAQGWNTSPFNIYPAKGRYMWRDMERLCDGHGLPLVRPDVFPQSALLAARTGVAAADQPWLAGFCRAMFHREYGEGGDITGEAAVAAAIAAQGIETAPWLARAQEPSVKQALKDRNEEAARLGIFGAPSFVCADGELFWGDDRLTQALAWAARR